MHNELEGIGSLLNRGADQPSFKQFRMIVSVGLTAMEYNDWFLNGFVFARIAVFVMWIVIDATHSVGTSKHLTVNA